MNSSAMVVPFVKAVACGNDFLIVDGQYAPADIAAFSRRICDRHQGAGADGVEWLFPSGNADIEARLWNADGSEAEISGNGTRCVAAHLCSERAKEKIRIQTGAGVKVCTLTSRSETQYEFEVAMGKPEVGQELTLQVGSRQVRGIPVSMGNPHYVVFCREFSRTWQGEAAEIGLDPGFKHGINVEFVTVKDPANIDVLFFERGVGETQSSGTGSCASAVAAISTQGAKSPVRVHTQGGVQTVRWEDQVYLRGFAQLVCRGEFFV